MGCALKGLLRPRASRRGCNNVFLNKQFWDFWEILISQKVPNPYIWGNPNQLGPHEKLFEASGFPQGFFLKRPVPGFLGHVPSRKRPVLCVFGDWKINSLGVFKNRTCQYCLCWVCVCVSLCAGVHVII